MKDLYSHLKGKAVCQDIPDIEISTCDAVKAGWISRLVDDVQCKIDKNKEEKAIAELDALLGIEEDEKLDRELHEQASIEELSRIMSKLFPAYKYSDEELSEQESLAETTLISLEEAVKPLSNDTEVRDDEWLDDLLGQQRCFSPLGCLKKQPEFPEEFNDTDLVILEGAHKYEADGWLKEDGIGTSVKEMHASMSRHLAEWYCGKTKDDESGLHPLLHLATRALMTYTRHCRGIINEKDL